MRVRRRHSDVENAHWIGFLLHLQSAAVSSGFELSWAKEIVGAVGELEDNVHVHSGNTHSGILAYSAEGSDLEIVVLDRGIGVLASLRRAPEFKHIIDHGQALQTALRDGNSSIGSDARRGWGFHDLFQGLASSNAQIRFRSGDHLLEVYGRAGLPGARLRQSAHGGGFLISVRVGKSRD